MTEPDEYQPWLKPQQAWTLVALVVSIVVGVGVGLWKDDLEYGGIVGAGLYVFSILTIIALKD